MRRLELAKELGDFLYVGLWDDEMIRYYRGDLYPVQSIQERVLMTMACRHVDDVVIGAPFIITQDLLTSLNINKVVVITDTEEDAVLKEHNDVDQFAIPREMGILEEVKVSDPFYDVTIEDIAKRVLANKPALEKKVMKKTKSESEYYENKVGLLEK